MGQFTVGGYARRETGPVCIQVLMLVPVMQFGQVRVIMGKGQVLVRVCMGLPNKSLSVMPVVVMIFVLMNMVML